MPEQFERPPVEPSQGEVTRLLRAWQDGDAQALDRLMPLVYDSLRQIAQAQLRHERPGHTLRPSAVINETYLKLVESPAANLQNRVHFFAVAARAMRQILVDHARRRAAQKRGGGEAVCRINYLTPAWLKIDPNFDSLRSNPRVQKLVAGTK